MLSHPRSRTVLEAAAPYARMAGGDRRVDHVRPEYSGASVAGGTPCPVLLVVPSRLLYLQELDGCRLGSTEARPVSLASRRPAQFELADVRPKKFA